MALNLGGVRMLLPAGGAADVAWTALEPCRVHRLTATEPFWQPHYGATAVATRAASEIRLPYRETVLVQLATSNANRLSAAVNAHCFVRRGLSCPAQSALWRPWHSSAP